MELLFLEFLIRARDKKGRSWARKDCLVGLELEFGLEICLESGKEERNLFKYMIRYSYSMKNHFLLSIPKSKFELGSLETSGVFPISTLSS